MYAGQLEMTSFLSVADTSFAKHVAGSCWAPETEKKGSFSAARLAPRKAAPPTPLTTVRRETPPGPPAMDSPSTADVVRIVSCTRRRNKRFRTEITATRRNPAVSRCWTDGVDPVSIGCHDQEAAASSPRRGLQSHHRAAPAGRPPFVRRDRQGGRTLGGRGPPAGAAPHRRRCDAGGR